MKNQNAFTLIELMIVVVIIGVLAAIAYPSYRDSVNKSHRADAEGVLMGLGNAMERHFTEINSYCDAANGGTAETDCGIGTGDTGVPSIYAIPSGTTSYYNVTISAATHDSFTLSAEPVGAQVNDRCGTLTLTHTGVKGNSAGLNQAECW